MLQSRTFPLFLTLLVCSGLMVANGPETKKATLVEALSNPRCYGLDCPPLPTAPQIAFCFQVGDVYYTGTDRSWGFTWGNKAMKLRKLEGQSLDIVVTDDEIRVLGPKVKTKLWVVHNYSLFKSDGCKHG
jgi:hypothetical protein